MEQEKMQCPECTFIVPPPPIIEDPMAGEYLCTRCGTVVQDFMISNEKEWRSFSDDAGDPSRVGNIENPFFGGIANFTGLNMQGPRQTTATADIVHNMNIKTTIVLTNSDFSSLIAEQIYALGQELHRNKIFFKQTGSSRLTDTGTGLFDDEGQEIPYNGEQAEKLERALQKLNETMEKVYGQIKQMAIRVNIQSNEAIDRAAQIVRNCEIVRILRLRCNVIEDFQGESDFKKPKPSTKDSIILGALMHGCRGSGMVPTFKEFGQKANLEFKEVGSAYKYLTDYVGEVTGVYIPEQIKTLAMRFCSSLNLERLVTHTVIAMLQASSDLKVIEGGNPNSVVASAIYFTTSLTNTPIYLEALSQLSGTSAYSLRNQIRKLIDREKDLFLFLSSEFIEKYRKNIRAHTKKRFEFI